MAGSLQRTIHQVKVGRGLAAFWTAGLHLGVHRWAAARRTLSDALFKLFRMHQEHFSLMSVISISSMARALADMEDLALTRNNRFPSGFPCKGRGTTTTRCCQWVNLLRWGGSSCGRGMREEGFFSVRARCRQAPASFCDDCSPPSLAGRQAGGGTPGDVACTNALSRFAAPIQFLR